MIELIQKRIESLKLNFTTTQNAILALKEKISLAESELKKEEIILEQIRGAYQALSDLPLKDDNLPGPQV